VHSTSPHILAPGATQHQGQHSIRSSSAATISLRCRNSGTLSATIESRSSHEPRSSNSDGPSARHCSDDSYLYSSNFCRQQLHLCFLVSGAFCFNSLMMSNASRLQYIKYFGIRTFNGRFVNIEQLFQQLLAELHSQIKLHAEQLIYFSFSPGALSLGGKLLAERLSHQANNKSSKSKRYVLKLC
jgi:hypothetical protein